MADANHPETRAVELRLRAARPTPEAAFVDGLERRLGLGSAGALRSAFGRFTGRRGRRPALAAGLAMLVIAGATFTLGLAGAGPLDDGPADAGDECRFVTVQKRIRVPVVVSGRDGLPEVRLDSRLVNLREKRCP